MIPSYRNLGICAENTDSAVNIGIYIVPYVDRGKVVRYLCLVVLESLAQIVIVFIRKGSEIQYALFSRWFPWRIVVIIIVAPLELAVYGEHFLTVTLGESEKTAMERMSIRAEFIICPA